MKQSQIAHCWLSCSTHLEENQVIFLVTIKISDTAQAVDSIFQLCL